MTFERATQDIPFSEMTELPEPMGDDFEDDEDFDDFEEIDDNFSLDNDSDLE